MQCSSFVTEDVHPLPTPNNSKNSFKAWYSDTNVTIKLSDQTVKEEYFVIKFELDWTKMAATFWEGTGPMLVMELTLPRRADTLQPTLFTGTDFTPWSNAEFVKVKFAG